MIYDCKQSSSMGESTSRSLKVFMGNSLCAFSISAQEFLIIGLQPLISVHLKIIFVRRYLSVQVVQNNIKLT